MNEETKVVFDKMPKLEVQAVEATGLNPKGVFLSHDKKTLYVTNFGQLDHKKVVTIYDADTLELKDQLDIPVVAVEAALSPDDKTLYVSSFWGHSVVFIDLATKAITNEVKVGHHPKVLALSQDGRKLYAANWSGESVSEIDIPAAAAGSGSEPRPRNEKAPAVTRTLKAGKNPRGLAVTANGTVYAANFFDESIDVFKPEGGERRDHRIPACKCPRHLVLSPDQKTLYISCLYKSQLHALDLESETVVHHAQLGAAPKSIGISADGRYVYSADYGTTRSVSVVDTKDWSAQTFIVPGMDRGSGVAVAADGHHAFVTGWYDAHLYRVGFEGTGGHPDEAKKKIAQWMGKPFSRDPGDSH